MYLKVVLLLVCTVPDLDCNMDGWMDGGVLDLLQVLYSCM